MKTDRGAEVVSAADVLSECFGECFYASSETLVGARHWHCPCGCGPTTAKRKNVKLCGSCGQPCVRVEYVSGAQLWACRACRSRCRR